MTESTVRFNLSDRPEFLKELRKKVNAHFKINNIDKYANFNMMFKTAFMISLYFIPFALMLTGIVSSFWLVMLMWVLMGFGMSGIGLSIMHDANHMSYSKHKSVNFILGYLINFLGAYHENWKIQHNMLHHAFTNVNGFDEDINTPIMRFSPHQKRRKYFRFQLYYAPFIYGLMTLYWFVPKDFLSLARYNKSKLLEKKGQSLYKNLVHLIFNKVWYLGLLLVLPMIVVALPWWQTLLGFLMMHYISGMVLTLIFQPAHVIEETAFFEPDEHGSVENNWAIHQMKTTSNFANGSMLFSWFIGGLNYQIEHHLFPNICHVHYRNIAAIVKETAEEYNIPYLQHKTFYGALKSHFVMIDQLGTGKFDKDHPGK